MLSAGVAANTALPLWRVHYWDHSQGADGALGLGAKFIWHATASNHMLWRTVFV